MSDVFDSIIGQDRAVTALRNFALNPTHAYLLFGPPGSEKLEAALAFASALQCDSRGCGKCEECQRVLRGSHPDVTVVARAGVNWSVDEIREAERIARRRPVHEKYQVIILPNIELSALAGPALLKTLEEPPRRTVFILLADELPDRLTTIESRCVKVAFGALGIDDIVTLLERDGVASVQAKMSAEAAAGDLDRARVLARDADLAARVRLWRDAPDRLGDMSPAALANEVISGLDAAIAPLQALHAEEMEAWRATLEMSGRRGGVKDVEQRQQREQRRFRSEELRFGLASLARAYRTRMVGALEGAEDGDSRALNESRSALAAIEAISAATKSLGLNANEQLLLTNLFGSLARA